MASEVRQATAEDLGPGGERRRDFLYVATAAFAGAGVVPVAWSLVNQMNPSADVLALASIDLDLSAVQPGQAIKASWRGKPVFVKHRSATEIAVRRASAFRNLAVRTVLCAQ